MKSKTFGRSSENDVVIPDNCIGRKHCQIIQDDNGSYRLIDFNSQNGTFVNGSKRYGEIRLKETDIVKMGNTTVPWLSYFEPTGPNSSINNDNTKNNSGGLGIASFVCGVFGVTLLSIAFGLIAWPYIYLIVCTSALAIVFGTMSWGLKRKNRGLAIAGFILGCTWALVCLIWIIVVATEVSTITPPVSDIPSYF